MAERRTRSIEDLRRRLAGLGEEALADHELLALILGRPARSAGSPSATATAVKDPYRNLPRNLRYYYGIPEYDSARAPKQTGIGSGVIISVVPSCLSISTTSDTAVLGCAGSSSQMMRSSSA